ncbi:MAG: DUF371 domain-containing protein [Candidatus Altiarchaeota archaeon]
MPSITIRARGHENITSKHETTLMFTKDDYVTLRGDCIIAVSADKACADLTDEFKEKLRSEEAKVIFTISCGGAQEKITAYGHPDLTLSDAKDMVVRKSTFTCPRTLAVKADKAAAQLDRKLVKAIAEGREVLIKIKAH